MVDASGRAGATSFEALADFASPAGGRSHIPLHLAADTDAACVDLVGSGMRGWKRELTATVAGEGIAIESGEPHPKWPGQARIILGPSPRSLQGTSEGEL